MSEPKTFYSNVDPNYMAKLFRGENFKKIQSILGDTYEQEVLEAEKIDRIKTKSLRKLWNALSSFYECVHGLKNITVQDPEDEGEEADIKELLIRLYKEPYAILTQKIEDFGKDISKYTSENNFDGLVDYLTEIMYTNEDGKIADVIFDFIDTISTNFVEKANETARELAGQNVCMKQFLENVTYGYNITHFNDFMGHFNAIYVAGVCLFVNDPSNKHYHENALSKIREVCGNIQSKFSKLHRDIENYQAAYSQRIGLALEEATVHNENLQNLAVEQQNVIATIAATLDEGSAEYESLMNLVTFLFSEREEMIRQGTLLEQANASYQAEYEGFHRLCDIISSASNGELSIEQVRRMGMITAGHHNADDDEIEEINFKFANLVEKDPGHATRRVRAPDAAAGSSSVLRLNSSKSRVAYLCVLFVFMFVALYFDSDFLHIISIAFLGFYLYNAIFN